MQTPHRIVLTAFFVAATVLPAAAQLTPDRYFAAAGQAADLTLPTETSSLSFFTLPQLALFRPSGAGPFPAIVLLHQCGGLRNSSNSWQNRAMLGWAREAVRRGYVALLLDSLGPRSVDTVCLGVKGGVNFARGLKDAVQAGEHLRRLDYVDKNRVVMAGFSWGAGVALMASSAKAVDALRLSDRFQALVAFYPPCGIRPANGAPPYDLVVPGIDRPLLVLLGGQDTETPPAECTDRLAPQQAAGAPVQWHVYADATHCFDCENLNNFSKLDYRGNAVRYLYDKAATQDATERMFGFFEQAFARAK